MATPSHMALDPLKVFAARLLALPIFSPLTPRSAAEEVFGRFCSTVSTVQASAAKSLGQFLHDQLLVAETYAQTLTPAQQAAVASPLAALRAAVTPLLCATCAGAGGRQCQGTPQDDAQIAQTGLCLRVLHEVHDHLLTDLRSAIVSWGRGAETTLKQSLTHSWGTAWPGLPRRVRPGPDPKVSAGTVFVDAGPPWVRHSQIALEVAVDELDWPSMLMIPWLFAHEFVCHAQQTPPHGKARAPCRPFCPFFEGWMDELAFLLVQANLVSGWFGAPASGFLDHYRQEVFNAAQQYRAWRYGDQPGGNPPVEAEQWLPGVRAARTVLRLFEASVPDANPMQRRRLGLQQLTALSFRIQAAAPSPEELDDTVDACLAAAARALAADDRPMQGRVLAVLTESDLNMSKWINGLRAAAGI